MLFKELNEIYDIEYIYQWDPWPTIRLESLFSVQELNGVKTYHQMHPKFIQQSVWIYV
jgi:hypothetical protein